LVLHLRVWRGLRFSLLRDTSMSQSVAKGLDIELILWCGFINGKKKEMDRWEIKNKKLLSESLKKRDC
jgi:hypothetical protein